MAERAYIYRQKKGEKAVTFRLSPQACVACTIILTYTSNLNCRELRVALPIMGRVSGHALPSC